MNLKIIEKRDGSFLFVFYNVPPNKGIFDNLNTGLKACMREGDGALIISGLVRDV